MKKRIISLLLSVMMVSCLSFPAFCGELDDGWTPNSQLFKRYLGEWYNSNCSTIKSVKSSSGTALISDNGDTAEVILKPSETAEITIEFTDFDAFLKSTESDNSVGIISVVETENFDYDIGVGFKLYMFDKKTGEKTFIKWLGSGSLKSEMYKLQRKELENFDGRILIQTLPMSSFAPETLPEEQRLPSEYAFCFSAYGKMVPDKHPTQGDYNDDEIVNVKDLLIMRKAYAKFSEEGYGIGHDGEYDVNRDSSFDAKDILLMRKFLAGWNVELFYCC